MTIPPALWEKPIMTELFDYINVVPKVNIATPKLSPTKMQCYHFFLIKRIKMLHKI